MKLNITIILGILLLATSGLFTVYYKNTQQQLVVLMEDKAKLTIAIDQQKAAIDAIQTQYKQQTTSLMSLAASNTSLSAERDALSNKLMKHDLEELSRRKPALVETRINNGTKELFSSFMSITSK